MMQYNMSKCHVLHVSKRYHLTALSRRDKIEVVIVLFVFFQHNNIVNVLKIRRVSIE